MPTTAANIPIELHDLIFDSFRLGPTADEYRGLPATGLNFVSISKRELGALALVCQWWAILCQRRIFREVTLRSREDFRELVSLMARPECRISKCIHALRVVQKGPSPPWIHLVCAKLRAKAFPHVATLDVHLEGPLSLSETQTVKSIHASLPRSLPIFSYAIWQLTLHCIRFKSFPDILHLTAEMPSLNTLSCERLTWTDPPDVLDVKPLTPVRYHVSDDMPVSVDMAQCSDNGMATLLGCCLFAAKSFRLQCEDVSAVSSLVSAISRSLDKVDHLNSVWFEIANESESGVSQCAGNLRFQSGIDDSDIFPSIRFNFKPSPLVRTMRTEVVAFDFTLEGRPISDMLDYCWEAIDEHVASLSDLRFIVFGFHSHEDLTLFDERVGTTKMPNLTSSGKLKYAVEVLDEGEWIWVSGSPGGEDEDEDTDQTDLRWHYDLDRVYD